MSSESFKTGLAAFLLTILAPGLGQLHNGQSRKGVSYFALILGFLVLSTAVGLSHSFNGLIVDLALILSVSVFVLCDAVFTAVRQAGGHRSPAHTWRSYLLGFCMLSISMGLIGRVPDTIPGVHAYTITADSMSPTLVSGDRIISDMRYCRSHPPQRGEVIVLREPTNNVLYTKRIVAIGGDTISLSGSKLQINGAVVTEPQATYEPVEGLVESGDFGPLTIPPDRFFVLGDNRNHSYDSRYWGAVGLERVIGKPLYIYWSNDKPRIGKNIH